MRGMPIPHPQRCSSKRRPHAHGAHTRTREWTLREHTQYSSSSSNGDNEEDAEDGDGDGGDDDDDVGGGGGVSDVV